LELLNGANKSVHAFGYNSAESKRIWMKSGALWVHCWGLVLADFKRDPCSSDSLGGSRFFILPVGKISRNMNRTTSIGVAVKTFGTEF